MLSILWLRDLRVARFVAADPKRQRASQRARRQWRLASDGERERRATQRPRTLVVGGVVVSEARRTQRRDEFRSLSPPSSSSRSAAVVERVRIFRVRPALRHSLLTARCLSARFLAAVRRRCLSPAVAARCGNDGERLRATSTRRAARACGRRAARGFRLRVACCSSTARRQLLVACCWSPASPQKSPPHVTHFLQASPSIVQRHARGRRTMFYASFVLTKSGPLSKIWLAAHWERKLSKAQILDTDVHDAVGEIMRPKQRLSLRTTGHLLLGLVRIYSKKAKYVLADCQEATMTIKLQFKTGGEFQLADKRDRSTISGSDQILDDLDTMPDITDFDTVPMQVQQSRIDDITLQEDNFDTRSVREQSLMVDDLGDCESNFDEEFERTRRTFELLQQSGGGHGLTRRSVSYLEDAASTAPTLPDKLDDDSTSGGGLLDDELDAQIAQLACRQHDENRPLDVDGAPRESSERGGVGRPRKRRKLIVDDTTTTSGDQMKANMANYADTLQPLDLAPPTKRLMLIKEKALVERILNSPATDLHFNDQLLDLYQSDHHVPTSQIDHNVPAAETIRRNLHLVDNIDDVPDPDEANTEETPSEAVLDEAVEQMEVEDEESMDQTDEENGVQNGLTSPQSRKRGRVKHEETEGDEEEEEGGEEEEERIFTRKTLNVLNTIASRLAIHDNEIALDDLLTKGSTHKSAAQKFYALLELHKSHAICVEQNEAFGAITITPGTSLHELVEQK